MRKITITRSDIDGDGSYVGSHDLSDFDGSIELAADLGEIHFAALKAAGNIRALPGSAIEVDGGVKASGDIEVGRGIWGIKAGGGIGAVGAIQTGWGIEAGGDIQADLGIEAGGDIKAGGCIISGEEIEASESIEAGGAIEARCAIQAGFSITCKGTLSSGLRIFAGLHLWRLPEPEEMTVTCEKLARGQLCYGTLIETGEVPAERREDPAGGGGPLPGGPCGFRTDG